MEDGKREWAARMNAHSDKIYIYSMFMRNGVPACAVVTKAPEDYRTTDYRRGLTQFWLSMYKFISVRWLSPPDPTSVRLPYLRYSDHCPLADGCAGHAFFIRVRASDRFFHSSSTVLSFLLHSLTLTI